MPQQTKLITKNSFLCYTMLNQFRVALPRTAFAVYRNYHCIALNSDNADFYNHRGDAYGSIGDFESALADFSKAIALNPDDADT